MNLKIEDVDHVPETGLFSALITLGHRDYATESQVGLEN
jgi:hypothetical protein